MKFNYIHHSPHLENIQIVKDMVDMYERYMKQEEEETMYFDPNIYPGPDYLFDWKNDSVYYFLSTYFFDGYNTETKKAIVDYTAKVFYSMKGTKEIFHYMETLLDLEFYGDWVYNGRELSLRLINLEKNPLIDDESEFFYNLKEFLLTLLFVSPDAIDIGPHRIEEDPTELSDPDDPDNDDPDDPDDIIYRHVIKETIELEASSGAKSYKLVHIGR